MLDEPYIITQGTNVVRVEDGECVARCCDMQTAIRVCALLTVSENLGPSKPLQCPQCGGYESDVFDSRKTEHGVRRRRTCLACGAKYRTIEQVETLTTPGEDV